MEGVVGRPLGVGYSVHGSGNPASLSWSPGMSEKRIPICGYLCHCMWHSLFEEHCGRLVISLLLSHGCRKLTSLFFPWSWVALSSASLSGHNLLLHTVAVCLRLDYKFEDDVLCWQYRWQGLALLLSWAQHNALIFHHFTFTSLLTFTDHFSLTNIPHTISLARQILSHWSMT